MPHEYVDENYERLDRRGSQDRILSILSLKIRWVLTASLWFVPSDSQNYQTWRIVLMTNELTIFMSNSMVFCGVTLGKQTFVLIIAIQMEYYFRFERSILVSC